MSKPRKPGWWYPWIFVGCMAIVVIVNGIMITFALDTFSGLETEGHYTKGLAYNQNLEGQKKQEALGWTVAVEFVPSGQPREGTVVANFRNRDGVPVEGLSVGAIVVRPAQKFDDLRLDFKVAAPGRYEAVLNAPLPGQWEVQLFANGSPGNYQMRQRIMVP